jgi:hypothetical protein
LLVPEARLNAFIAEAFSSVQQIYLAHASLLDKLMERQRTEWPLVSAIPADHLLCRTALRSSAWIC